MLNQIYKTIKKYDTIVIARHIGVDPDAMASQIALRDAILLTFPKKKVYAVGSGSSKFSYLGKLDKLEDLKDEKLLIVLDTPDKRRVDGVDVDSFADSIKIDHHPFMEKFCELELIDDTASSTCQLIIDLIYHTKLKMNTEIAGKLFLGLVSDSNRFLFQNSTEHTFRLVADLLRDYHSDIVSLYQDLYMRPLHEVRLQGYIAQNMIVTDHGVGYIKLTSDIISKFQADAGSAGNMVNNFNYIEEVLVWATISEDKKNNIIKVNIRSRGPQINHVAEKYNGGGHALASGARVPTMEEAEQLIEDLDSVCEQYLK